MLLSLSFLIVSKYKNEIILAAALLLPRWRFPPFLIYTTINLQSIISFCLLACFCYTRKGRVVVVANCVGCVCVFPARAAPFVVVVLT